MKIRLTPREKKLKRLLDLYRGLAGDAIELADQYSGKDSTTVQVMIRDFDKIDEKMRKFLGD